MPWTRWNCTYTQEDVDAFDQAKNNSDPALIDRYFGRCSGRPFQNVFGSAVDGNGKANTPRRPALFTNFLAFRQIRTDRPDVTVLIWSGRGSYVFAGKPDHQNGSIQQQFVELFGRDRAKRIAELARKAGLDPEKGAGLPDLAVYFPVGDVRWRFIELKRPENGDTLSPKQRDWLCLLATHLGPESAVEWRWDKR